MNGSVRIAHFPITLLSSGFFSGFLPKILKKALGACIFAYMCDCVLGHISRNCSAKPYILNLGKWDFPGGAVVENLPANAGDTGLSPGPGRSHMPQSN